MQHYSQGFQLCFFVECFRISGRIPFRVLLLEDPKTDLIHQLALIYYS